MKTKHFFIGLFVVSALNIVLSGTLSAGVFRDDFDRKELSNLWVVKIEGKASYKIANGQMTQTSPAVKDGICIYYSIPLKGDVTCEVKADASTLEVDAADTVSSYAQIGFFDKMLAPTINTDMHPHYIEILYFDKDTKAIVLNDGKPAAGWNRLIPHMPIKEGWHVWRIEVKGKRVKFFIDGNLEGEGDTIVTDRYFIVSVDPYTSHYFGTFTVDYVELIGESVVPLAVESRGKLTTTWGDLKAR